MQQVLFFLEVLGSDYGSFLKADFVIYNGRRGFFFFYFCFVSELVFEMNQDICVHVHLDFTVAWIG